MHRVRADLLVRTGRDVVVGAVSARTNRDRGVDLAAARFFADPRELAAQGEIDLFVELIGGADGAAYEAVRAALSRGLSVVTANKAMLAAHGVELAGAGRADGVALAFEAAVGGGVPVIKTLREGLAGNTIAASPASSTAPAITSVAHGDRAAAVRVCLAEAQKLGYAEADPTFDIGGFDTAHKLAILASLAFGTRVDASAVSIEGIEQITLADLVAADELGFRIKLLGVAERTDHGIEQRVHPTMVAKSHPSPRPWACSTR